VLYFGYGRSHSLLTRGETAAAPAYGD
jgi:hypothetical protein